MSESPVVVPFEQLSREALRAVLESFVAREGTDYGEVECSLDEKVADVRRQFIASGQLPGVLDPEVVSQAVVGMWARVFAWWAEDPSRAPRETVIETLTRIQLHGTYPTGAPDAPPSRSDAD